MERISQTKDKLEGKYGNGSRKVVKHWGRVADVSKVATLCGKKRIMKP